MTLKQIHYCVQKECEKLRCEIIKKREEEATMLEEWLTLNGLDKVVIRNRDRKRGYLKVTQSRFRDEVPIISFYPITAKGKISENQSGWIGYPYIDEEELLGDYSRCEVTDEN